MAQLGMVIDPATVPPDDRNFDLIPSGTTAMARIIESDVSPTKDGKGKLIPLTWEILDGPFAKRRIWENVNIVNGNPKAQEIGQRHWSSILVATGVGAVDDTQAVHFKPVLIKVGIEKSKDGNYPDKNKVAGVKPVGAMNPANVGVSHPQAKAAAVAPAATWAQPAARPATPQPGSTPWGKPATPDNAAKAPF